jgi:hypothetical protein
MSFKLKLDMQDYLDLKHYAASIEGERNFVSFYKQLIY